MRRNTVLAITAAVTALVLGVIITWWHLAEPPEPRMGDFGPKKQWEKAVGLVAGLNTRDTTKVPVLGRGWGEPETPESALQRKTIEAAMPLSGCHYTLLSVNDLGPQGIQQIPGTKNPISTYRFDMTVNEACPNLAPFTREIGVLAVADMGFWEPVSFVP